MNQSKIHFQLLLPSSVDHLITQPVGKLLPVSAQETESTTFTALDCFDQPLRHSGRLLLEIDGDFELLRDDGPLVFQSATGQPRFINDFADGPLRQALSDLSPLRKLLPVGAGTRQQMLLAFIDDEGKTHCRARLLKFASETGPKFSLVELQGVRGYGKSLQQLRAHIERLGGAQVDCGALYKQLFPTLALYNAKAEIAIHSSETAFDAANKIIASCLPIMQANEAGIMADHDTEFLHDYRVQLRKIRSVLSLFKGVYDDAQTADLKARFSALAAPTGRLRDLDVYLLERDTYHDYLPESLHDGLDALLDLFSDERASEQEKLSQHLRSAAYKREVNRLAKLFKRQKDLAPGPNADQSAHDYACEQIWQHYRKVRKAALRIGPDTPDEEVHDLRIRCKKLRYLIEFFSTVFPKPALNKLLKPLKRLQDNLGLFNDYSVQQESLQAFLQKPGSGKGDSDLSIAQSVGALIAVLHGRQLEERNKALVSLARFNRPDVQQTFSDLFQNRKDDT
ncbi:MAG: CHAD domain-containing protein [Alcaligenaceae bacterium]|nr:CHAD domain-containing protein [Alcaligenaceae bacterium]